jgi:hypothetical protein
MEIHRHCYAFFRASTLQVFVQIALWQSSSILCCSHRNIGNKFWGITERIVLHCDLLWEFCVFLWPYREKNIYVLRKYLYLASPHFFPYSRKVNFLFQYWGWCYIWDAFLPFYIMAAMCNMFVFQFFWSLICACISVFMKSDLRDRFFTLQFYIFWSKGKGSLIQFNMIDNFYMVSSI